MFGTEPVDYSRRTQKGAANYNNDDYYVDDDEGEFDDRDRNYGGDYHDEETQYLDDDCQATPVLSIQTVFGNVSRCERNPAGPYDCPMGANFNQYDDDDEEDYFEEEMNEYRDDRDAYGSGDDDYVNDEDFERNDGGGMRAKGMHLRHPPPIYKRGGDNYRTEGRSPPRNQLEEAARAFTRGGAKGGASASARRSPSPVTRRQQRKVDIPRGRHQISVDRVIDERRARGAERRRFVAGARANSVPTNRREQWSAETAASIQDHLLAYGTYPAEKLPADTAIVHMNANRQVQIEVPRHATVGHLRRVASERVFTQKGGREFSQLTYKYGDVDPYVDDHAVLSDFVHRGSDKHVFVSRVDERTQPSDFVPHSEINKNVRRVRDGKSAINASIVYTRTVPIIYHKDMSTSEAYAVTHKALGAAGFNVSKTNGVMLLSAAGRSAAARVDPTSNENFFAHLIRLSEKHADGKEFNLRWATEHGDTKN